MSDYVQGEFEVEFLPYLQGTIGAKLYEVGKEPSRILNINEDCVLEVDWSLTGAAQRFICGSWGIDVYMESIGRGPEFELPDEDLQSIPLNPPGDGHYHRAIPIPAGTVKTHVESWLEELQEGGGLVGEPETDIVYKMVVTVTYRDVGGRPGPIAGFVEMPMLQFYDAD